MSPPSFVEIDGQRFDLDPPGTTYPEPRTARIELSTSVRTPEPS